MKSFIVLAICLFGLAQAGQIKFTDCGSKTGIIEYVEVSDCNAAPCTLKKGQDASLTLRFTASVDTSKLTSQVNGIKYGVPLPFPLPEPDSCKLGATCPVSRGESNEISITLPILSVYPSLNIDVRWIVYDDKNNQMVCFKFPVSIQG
jgi:Niemann-Pick C2 protein